MAKDELTRNERPPPDESDGYACPDPIAMGPVRDRRLTRTAAERINDELRECVAAETKCGPETLESEFVGVERPVGVRRVPGSRRAGPLGEKRHAAREDQH